MSEQETSVVDPGSYPRVGDVLGDRYELTGVINAGGMGVIMRARQLAMDRDVAVKLLLPQSMAKEKTKARFEREIHLAKQLNHPNVIKLVDYGKHGEFVYLVMELLEGEDLKRIIRREAPLSMGRTLDIALQIADALKAAHEGQIVHRDLKPANVFITKLGTGRDFVKLLDFGIAKSLESSQFDVTRTGEVSGTVAYISPDLIRGGAPNKSSDVYALGVLILEMLTGRKVFEGNTMAETLMNHMNEPFRTPARFANRPLHELLDRMLAKDATERIPDAGTLLAELQQVAAASDPDFIFTIDELNATYGVPADAGEQTSSSNLVAADSDTNVNRGSTKQGMPVVDLSRSKIDPGSARLKPKRKLSDITAERERLQAADTDRGIPIVPVVGLLVVAILVGVVALDWFGRQRAQESEPVRGPDAVVAPAKDEGVEVFVASTPSGADVFEDDTRVGRTPLRMVIDSEHDWELRLDGYEPRVLKVDPTMVAPIDVTLVAVPPPEVADAGLEIGLDIGLVATDGGGDLAAAETEVAKTGDSPATPAEARSESRTAKKKEQKSRKKTPEEPESAEDDGLDVFGSAPAAEKAPEVPPAPSTGPELYEAARKAFVANKHAESVRLCKEALAKGESSCNALMANAYRLMGKTSMACRYYKAAGIEHKSCVTLQRR